MRDLPREWPNWIDCKATMTVVAAAIIASASEFLGKDQARLHLDPVLIGSEPWRFFTSTLLHGGWLHLAFNVYWTLRLGLVLEAVFGELWMLAIYLFLGVGSSAVQWAFSGPAVGLSGIGYGLFGLLWILHRFHPRYRAALDASTIQLFVAWFFVCIALDWLGIMPIANWAHGAGAVLGALLGWTLTPLGPPRWMRIGFLFSAVLAIVAAGTTLRPLLNPKWAYWERALRDAERVDWSTRSATSWSETMAELEERVRREPRSAQAWLTLGMARDAAQDASGAGEAYRRSAELEPDNALARTFVISNLEARAEAAYAAGQAGEAAGHLRNVLEHDPQRAATWVRLATLLEEQGDVPGALAALERAASLQELEPDARDRLLRLRGR